MLQGPSTSRSTIGTWLYAKNRSKIARVDEETSLLSTSDENPFDPHNGLEITKF